MILRRPRLSLLGLGAITGTALAAAICVATPARADGLAGEWTGGGVVTFPDGHRERAKCRAHYSHSGNAISLNGVCATASGSVDQTAQMRQVGPNSYAGSFYNEQFGIRGSIHVSVRGKSQTVSLKGDSGSASLTLLQH
jgi:hypothetical protein